jgi:sporulation protein YlmC with PRC-barrel domain
MQPRRLDLLREMLDHEVVDTDGVSCGMVDDLEFRAGERGPELVALLVGPGAWAPRLPALFAVLAQALFGHARVRVPWHQVDTIGETIRLQSTAAELGLGRLDRKVGRWIARLPMS